MSKPFVTAPADNASTRRGRPGHSLDSLLDTAVAVFNDFVNPLYCLPGSPTVQLTLYNFQSQFNTQFNLLFTNILLITIPPLIVFLFFNRQIVAGLTAGAVKG